jgi:catechol 2,3-dioxygenase-like lactoylglutathione lyase family enzyme
MSTQGITSFDASTLCQIAIVVKSVDTAVKFYTEVFGIGPFHVMPVAQQQATYGNELRTIQIQISVKSGTPLTKGTYAQLGSQGVTGLSYVILDDDGSKPEPLTGDGGELAREARHGIIRARERHQPGGDLLRLYRAPVAGARHRLRDLCARRRPGGGRGPHL